MIKKINSQKDFINLAQKFSKNLKKKDIVVLNGELGAGKTTFVKGIAKGLGIEEVITSPTYTIVKEYKNILCHIDAYRIHDEDLGVGEYLEKNFIICIEWSKNIQEFINPNYVINISYTDSGREVEILKKR